MIGAVLSPTVETLLVRAPVCLVQLTMKFPVRSVVTSMSTIVVVMGPCRCGWCHYSQHRRSNENFADDHDYISSPRRASGTKRGTVASTVNSTVVKLNPTGMRRLATVHGTH